MKKRKYFGLVSAAAGIALLVSAVNVGTAHSSEFETTATLSVAQDCDIALSSSGTFATMASADNYEGEAMTLSTDFWDPLEAGVVLTIEENPGGCVWFDPNSAMYEIEVALAPSAPGRAVSAVYADDAPLFELTGGGPEMRLTGTGDDNCVVRTESLYDATAWTFVDGDLVFFGDCTVTTTELELEVPAGLIPPSGALPLLGPKIVFSLCAGC